MVNDPQRVNSESRIIRWSGRRLGIGAHLLLMGLILLAPCWLFCIQRLPAWLMADVPFSTYVHQNLAYRLLSDDFAYINGSRNWSRTVDNLFVPHNTHICPSWRILNWGVIQASGDLISIPAKMQFVTYLGLILTMLSTGHFVAYESRSMLWGYLATIFVGVTSLQWMSTVWYSAGQTLWAGAFIVTTLVITQEILRRNWNWAWPFVVLSCWIAGGFWTIGHAAGPVAAIYILATTRGKRRLLALIPFLATIFLIVVSLIAGAHKIDPTVSFHGRTLKESVDPIRGIVNTCHAIIENLALGSLGITSNSTDLQAVLLLGLLILVWLNYHLRAKIPIQPMEWAGGSIFVSAYLVEWTFRGYFSWVDLKFILPWYDSIPLIGWVIFICGWCCSGRLGASPTNAGTSIGKIWVNRREAAAVLGALLMMMLLHQSEVERQLIGIMPPLTDHEVEIRKFPVPNLRALRSVYLWEERVKWQRRHILKLQQAEAIAQKQGWSVEDVHNALGRVRLPMIPEVYDAAYMMDIPVKSTKSVEVTDIKRVLGPLLELEPEPRPLWLIGIDEKWPPEGWETKP